MACANWNQLDIAGLTIVVTSGDAGAKSVSKLKSKKSKGAEGLEILSNAHLKLKEGRRYALVGRNGTGKSSEYPQTGMIGHKLTRKP